MSHQRSAGSNPNLLTPTESHDELLHRPILRNKTYYQTAHPSRESLLKKPRRGLFRPKSFKNADHHEVDDLADELIGDEILDSCGQHEKPSDGPTRDYMRD